MENWKAIRQDVLMNGLSQRAACAKYKLGWHTLKKIMAYAEPPGYRQQEVRPKRVLAAEDYLPRPASSLLGRPPRLLPQEPRSQWKGPEEAAAYGEADLRAAEGGVRIPGWETAHVAAHPGRLPDQRQNVLLVGPSGTGKSHLATALGMAACAQGRKVRFFRVTELVTQLLEAKEERQLQRYRQQLNKLDLLVLDELGSVPAKQGRSRTPVRCHRHRLRTEQPDRDDQSAVRKLD